MTGANRELNAADELSRAEECLREARLLQSSGLPYGAASRAYYAVFHGTRAVLFSVGLEPQSHRGAISMLGQHFVKTGKLSSEMGRLVSRMQRDREDADYSTAAVFGNAEAVEMVRDAERFLDQARLLVSHLPTP